MRSHRFYVILALCLVFGGAIPTWPIRADQISQVVNQSASPAWVRGAIRDALTQQPVTGAEVSIVELRLTTVSSETGLFSFESVVLATDMMPVTVTVTAVGYGLWQYTDVMLIADDTLILDVILTPGDMPTLRHFVGPRAEQGGCQVQADKPALTQDELVALQSLTLPETIRVGRQSSGWPNCQAGLFTQVDVVPFKDYVKHVLPKEWFASWPRESLRAGAMAVKMYAWYWISVGGKWKNHVPPADVMDSTCDQVYDPTVSYASTNAAVDDTWNYAMVRNNSVFPLHYCATCTACTFCVCGQNCMGQWESRDRANEGYTWSQILQMYYANVEIIPIDNTPPTTSVSFSGAAGDDGWYRSDVQVTLSASDDRSGVKLTQYRVNGGGWQTYSGAFTVSGAGAHTVGYRSQDNVGNLEAEKTANIKIDIISPTGSLLLNNNASTSHTVLVYANATANDAHSGVYQMRLRDAGRLWTDWLPFSASTLWQLPAVTGQTHTVEVQFRDRAGNISTTYQDAIVLDIYPARPASAGYRLTRSTWGAAGVDSRSAGYHLLGTFGQPSMIGQVSSANYRLSSGYWLTEGKSYTVYLPIMLCNQP